MATIDFIVIGTLPDSLHTEGTAIFHSTAFDLTDTMTWMTGPAFAVGGRIVHLVAMVIGGALGKSADTALALVDTGKWSAIFFFDAHRATIVKSSALNFAKPGSAATPSHTVERTIVHFVAMVVGGALWGGASIVQALVRADEWCAILACILDTEGAAIISEVTLDPAKGYFFAFVGNGGFFGQRFGLLFWRSLLQTIWQQRVGDLCFLCFCFLFSWGRDIRQDGLF